MEETVEWMKNEIYLLRETYFELDDFDNKCYRQWISQPGIPHNYELWLQAKFNTTTKGHEIEQAVIKLNDLYISGNSQPSINLSF